ncbi:MAG TPA: FAD-dependent oxidoreductase [Dermatophilaceae bacterium]|nr:FAD-dependent oxidoreductase [Dermatophilaceae bacterium]
MTHALWAEGLAGGERAAYRTGMPPGEVDVCIVGGDTGLWTAYYLLGQHPSLSVCVLEAEQVGFGTSGRNGGWVSALWPVSADTLAAEVGEGPTRSMLAALRETVDEVGAVAAAEGIACDYVKGGMVLAARSPAQVARARSAAAAGARWGDGTVWLDLAEARERLCATELLGASYNPHCARVQPRRLVDGLAAAVRRLGGVICEGARVVGAEPGAVRLASGAVVRTRHTVRATEAYTARLPGLRRRLAPVYSLIIATEPLPQGVWAQIGLAEREVFADHRHVVVYGQRTDGDRLVFGGRGAPYHWGSRIEPVFDAEPRVFDMLWDTVRELFPVLDGYAVTHRWGGPLGIPRDWHPSVGYDPVARLGWAGGYVGDGVAASNLAGRTLADLVVGRRSSLAQLPWVGHRPPDWEPEPLRWLGVTAGLRVAEWADREERITGRPALLGRALGALTGH